jgi:hypothetical protein
MTKHLPKGKQKVRKPSRRNRQVQAAKNLAKGMGVEQALTEAGYSRHYASTKGYKVVKKPYIQSIFTEALERVMKLRNKEFDAIIAPYIDALDAPLVVKSTTEGIACIAKDPETQEVIPDHDTRMKAADRLVDLYGGKAKTDDDEPDTGPKRVFIRKYVTVEVDHVHHVASGNAGILNGHGAGANDGTVAATVVGGTGSELATAARDGAEPAAPSAAAGSGVPGPVEGRLQPDAGGTESTLSDAGQSDRPVSRRVVRRQILPGLHDAQRDGADDL